MLSLCIRCISPRLAGEATNYDASENTVSFTLAEKDKMWIPYVFYNPGFYDETVRIEQEGILNWICTTLNYYKSLQGDLTVPEHPILGYMTERCLYQSLGAIGMNEKDEIVGANWGTYPATERTWNKDMFYSVMALHHTNDPVFTKSLEWFLKYSVRKKGTKYEGRGISLSEQFFSSNYFGWHVLSKSRDIKIIVREFSILGENEKYH